MELIAVAESTIIFIYWWCRNNRFNDIRSKDKRVTSMLVMINKDPLPTEAEVTTKTFLVKLTCFVNETKSFLNAKECNFADENPALQVKDNTE